MVVVGWIEEGANGGGFVRSLASLASDGMIHNKACGHQKNIVRSLSFDLCSNFDEIQKKSFSSLKLNLVHHRATSGDLNTSLILMSNSLYQDRVADADDDYYADIGGLAR